jgi:hypothetical protein
LREKAALHFLGFIIFAAANTSHGCYIVNDWCYLIMRHSGSLIIFALYIYMIMDDIYVCVCCWCMAYSFANMKSIKWILLHGDALVRIYTHEA